MHLAGTMRATPEGALTRYRLTSWSPTERDAEAHDDESVDEAEAETATEMEQMEPSEATVSEMLQSTSDICDYCGWVSLPDPGSAVSAGISVALTCSMTFNPDRW